MDKTNKFFVNTAIKPLTTKAMREMTAAREVVSMRSPTMARSAGSNVMDATIMTATAVPMPIANPVTNESPMVRSPRAATMTVMPAKTTARPEVSIDSMLMSKQKMMTMMR